MSSNYPMLYGPDKDTEPSEDVRYFAADDSSDEELTPGAPPADAACSALQEMEDLHASTCALCQKPFDTSANVASARLSCGHPSHMLCVQLLLAVKPELKSVSLDRIGGIGSCNHCSDRAMATGVVGASNDTGTSWDVCLDEMKRLHKSKYPSQDVDAILETELSKDDIRAMVGVSRVGSAVDSLAENLRSGWRSFAARGKDESVWSAAGNAVSEVRAASTQAADKTDLRDVLHGREFIDAMKKNGRTIDDVFETFKYTLPHLFLAGVQTMDELVELGFDARRHLKPAMRCAIPLFLLAERYSFDFKRHMSQLDPEEVAACGLHHFELPLINLTATDLVQGRFQTQHIKRMGISLDKLVRFAGLQLPHAIALGLTPDVIVHNWAIDLRNVHSPSYALYKSLCEQTNSPVCSTEQLQAMPVKRTRRKPRKVKTQR